MMKKAISLALAVVLCLPLSLSTFAADSLDMRLQKVTVAVKSALGIGDSYQSFQGNSFEDGINSYWHLNWRRDNDSLDVTADENGRILSYNRYIMSTEPRYYDSHFAPAFPKTTRDDAKTAAMAFLSKVLAKNETMVFNEKYVDTLLPRGEESYYFYGNISLNGYESPIGVSVSVSAADMKVSYFSRYDTYQKYLNGLPSSAITPAISREKAAELLSSKVSLELRYVRSNDDGKLAVLRYVPLYNGRFIVDAQSGRLMDLDQIIKDLPTMNDSRDMAAPSAPSTVNESAKGQLTTVELSGIEKLAGVMSKEQLDKTVRAMAPLAIGGDFVLGNVSYMLNSETGDVNADLQYSTKENIDYAKNSPSGDAIIKPDFPGYIMKSVNINARTGELNHLYTSYPYGKSYEISDKEKADAQKKGEQFLSAYFGSYYKKTALYKNDNSLYPFTGAYSSPAESFLYARNENGLPFPDNSMSVGVNAKTGAIDSFYKYWDDDIKFDEATGIVSPANAVEAYAGAFTTTLSYTDVPIAIDPSLPIYRPYIEMGYGYVYELKLAYANVSPDQYVAGVDAKTGKAVVDSYIQPKQIPQYNDIANSPEKEKIKKLALYGIGFAGGSFKPAGELTQRDMLILLSSADGYIYNDDEGLYSYAVSRGIFSPSAKRLPAAPVGRMDYIKTLLSMSGYDKTAHLAGIYKTSFSDESAIASNDLGYAAIALGMGLVKGDSEGRLNPAANVTREEAAAILYNFMSR